MELPRPMSYQEYLAVELHSESRHEFIDGVVVAMAGGSDEHNALSARLSMVVGLRLPRGCRYYSSDQRYCAEPLKASSARLGAVTDAQGLAEWVWISDGRAPGARARQHEVR